MSFSSAIKKECVKNKPKDALTKKALLTGITHAAGKLIIGSKRGVEYVTETYEVAKHIASIAASIYELETQIIVKRSSYRKSITEVKLIGGGVEAMLKDMGMLNANASLIELYGSIPPEIIATREQKRAFLRGAFLGAGSISNPKRTYHMEIVCEKELLSKTLLNIFNDLDCPAKSVLRKDKSVIYLKDGDKISSFLAIIDAPYATFDFEDARAERELRNYINRTSNCETANIGKTVNASSAQIEAIEKIIARGELKKLSPSLREAAELRVNNPELSLNELAELAGIGKSGIHHRLSRLIEYANEL